MAKPLSYPSFNSSIAQLVEQLTVNQWVPGSSPGRGAIYSKGLQEIVSLFFCLKTARGSTWGSTSIPKYLAFFLSELFTLLKHWRCCHFVNNSHTTQEPLG